MSVSRATGSVTPKYRLTYQILHIKNHDSFLGSSDPYVALEVQTLRADKISVEGLIGVAKNKSTVDFKSGHTFRTRDQSALCKVTVWDADTVKSLLDGQQYDVDKDLSQEFLDDPTKYTVVKQDLVGECQFSLSQILASSRTNPDGQMWLRLPLVRGCKAVGAFCPNCGYTHDRMALGSRYNRRSAVSGNPVGSTVYGDKPTTTTLSRLSSSPMRLSRSSSSTFSCPGCRTHIHRDGIIIVHCEELITEEDDDVYRLRLEAFKLRKVDGNMFHRKMSDPRWILLDSRGNRVGESRTYQDREHILFEFVSISKKRLLPGQKYTLEFWDANDNGRDKFIGSCPDISFEELERRVIASSQRPVAPEWKDVNVRKPKNPDPDWFLLRDRKRETAGYVMVRDFYPLIPFKRAIRQPYCEFGISMVMDGTASNECCDSKACLSSKKSPTTGAVCKTLHTVPASSFQNLIQSIGPDVVVSVAAARALGVSYAGMLYLDFRTWASYVPDGIRCRVFGVKVYRGKEDTKNANQDRARPAFRSDNLEFPIEWNVPLTPDDRPLISDEDAYDAYAKFFGFVDPPKYYTMGSHRYRQRLLTCLGGPTEVTYSLQSMINEEKVIIQRAWQAGKHRHSVIKLLVDGLIDDMQELEVVIAETAKRLPITFIFYGIGNADFTALRRLDDLPDLQNTLDNVAFFELSADPVQADQAGERAIAAVEKHFSQYQDAFPEYRMHHIAKTYNRNKRDEKNGDMFSDDGNPSDGPRSPTDAPPAYSDV